MRHHKQTDVSPAEIPLQPLRHIQIKMVGRLVQNQEIGLGYQHIRQSHPFQLTSGKMFDLLAEVPDF